MKKVLIASAFLVTVVSCSRKTVPPANTHVITTPTTPVHADTSANLSATNVDSTTSVTTHANIPVMVVTDPNGKIITSEKNLPADAEIKFNSLELSKGFTPQQKINLNTRYKTIPPRVLYVAKEYQLTSLRGTYYIFKKKFWYWKKKDGLFYLDEKYYL